MLKNDQNGLHFFIAILFLTLGLLLISSSKKALSKEVTPHKTEQLPTERSVATIALVEQLATKPADTKTVQTTVQDSAKQSAPMIVELEKTSGSIKMTPNNDKIADKQLLFETLTGWRQALDGYVIQKEITAWTAATLYVAGLLAIVGFIFEKQISCSLAIILFFPILLTSYAFAVFIHSHYSSLYEQATVGAATTRCISKLVGNANWNPDFTLKDGEAYPAFLIKERDELRSKFCQFERNRFLNILWCLWTGQRGSLSTIERQEAATYSILILTTLTAFGYLMRYLDFGFWRRLGKTFLIKYKNLLRVFGVQMILTLTRYVASY